MRQRVEVCFGTVVGLGVLVGNASAQFQKRKPSHGVETFLASVNAATVSQRIGLTDITITYHRPEVGGREIWGKTVPFGKSMASRRE